MGLGSRALWDVRLRRWRAGWDRGSAKSVQMHDVPLAAPRDHRRDLERLLASSRQSESRVRPQHPKIAELVAFASRFHPARAILGNLDTEPMRIVCARAKAAMIIVDVAGEVGPKAAFPVAIGIVDGLDQAI